MTTQQIETNQPMEAGVEATEVELELKNAFMIANNALEHWKEPTNKLVCIRDYLLDAAQKDRVSKDPVFAKFLYEKCAPGLTKKLAKERSNDNNYLRVCAGVLEAFIKLFIIELRNKRYDPNFMEAMTWCFAPEASLHSHAVFQISEDELREMRIKQQRWRLEVKPGDRVDICVEADKVGRVTGWCQATVMAVDLETKITTLYSRNSQARSMGH
jgi:hypothetical protein